MDFDEWLASHAEEMEAMLLDRAVSWGDILDWLEAAFNAGAGSPATTLKGKDSSK